MYVCGMIIIRIITLAIIEVCCPLGFIPDNLNLNFTANIYIVTQHNVLIIT